MKLFFVAVAALLASTSTSFADVVTYECRVKSVEEQGFIAPNLFFSVDAEAGKAAVFDGVINDYYGKPVDGKFSTNRKGEQKVKWYVDGTAESGGTLKTKMSYELTFNPESKAIRIRARFIRPSLSNRPAGDGICVLLNGKTTLF